MIAGDPRDRPAARVLVNALALRAAGDAAQVYLENVLALLPEVWPAAEVHVAARAGAAVPAGPAETHRFAVASTAARLRAEFTALPRLVDRLRPDVFVSPNESVPLRVDAPVVIVAQNLLYHCPGVGPLPFGPLRARARSRAQFAFYRRQFPRAYRRADAVVAVSEHAARELERHAGLDRRKVSVVAYGADRLPVRPRTARAAARQILVVGSISHYKRLDVAVRALAVLRSRGHDYELVLAGGAWPGCGEALERAARDAGVASAVRSVGAVGADELADLLAAAAVSLSLSRCESFGIPIVESMHAG
ncbi:MAG TPA: glycosyltransferase, partial [Gaiellaceae bacterium]|nr:glycosyltransferase [Gaiellaceae bacterium]